MFQLFPGHLASKFWHQENFNNKFICEDIFAGVMPFIQYYAIYTVPRCIYPGLPDAFITTFIIKTSDKLIPRAPWRIFKLHEKLTALKRENSSLQNNTFLHFFFFYVLFFPTCLRIWIRTTNRSGSGRPQSFQIRIRNPCKRVCEKRI